MAARALTIEQTYFIRKSPKRVFRALTDADELTRWFLRRASITPKKGSEYEFEWIGGYSHRSTVLDVKKDRRLVLGWPNIAGKATLVTRATFTVTKSGAGTLLRLTHGKFPLTSRWVEVYGGTQSGWAYFLLNLKSVLEHGLDLRSPKDG